MAAESDIKRQEVQKNTKIVEELMINISKERKKADEQQVNIEAEKVKIEK